MDTNYFNEKINEESDLAVLSSFYLITIIYQGKEYHSSEHLYQSLRYSNSNNPVDLQFAESIRTVKTPYAARVLGNQMIARGRKRPWMNDTDKIILSSQSGGLRKTTEDESNINLMRIAVTEKFTQSGKCRNVLLATTKPLVCYSEYEDFWSIKWTYICGIGLNAWHEPRGYNNLGKLLTDFRDNIKVDLSLIFVRV
jgi:ribA/ribD-fused uncharacterized protein